MNWTLIRSFWLHRLRSRIRMLLLALAVFLTLGGILMVPRLWVAVPTNCVALTLLIGIGMISQDVSSGAAQLILARPVKRSEYVYSRAFATASAAILVFGLELAAGLTIAAARGARPSALDAGAAVVAILSGAIPTAAIVVLFSSVTRGLVDFGIYAAIFFVKTFTDFAAWASHREWVADVATALGWITSPGVSMEVASGGGRALWVGLIRALILTGISITVAVMALRRRELSYSD